MSEVDIVTKRGNMFGKKHSLESRMQMSKTKQGYKRICTKCKIVWSRAHFNVNEGAKDNLHPWCKSCWTLKNKKEYWDNRTESLIKNKKWREAHKHIVRNNHLMRNYGITLKQSEEILVSQGNKCPICGTTEPTYPGWVVDHDHVTGVTRSILCNECNRGLGQFKDNIERLEKAITYLKNWKLENPEIMNERSQEN